MSEDQKGGGKKRAQSVWGESPAGTAFARDATPGTNEFFVAAYRRTSAYEMPWLPEVVPFHAFANKRTLEVGCGAGFDAFTLVEHVLRGGYRRESFEERLSAIEFSTAADRPLVRVYGRGQVRRLLKREGFRVRKIQVRKLVAEDLPNVRFVRGLRALIPGPVLDRLGRLFGWYVVARAVKVPR